MNNSEPNPDDLAESNHTQREKEPRVQPGFSWYGVFFAACAAVGYTLANAFLRQLSEATPHEWVVTCKASCTTLIFLPWLIMLGIQGKKLFPPLRICGLLLFAAIMVQVAGNLAYQWALSQIGLALTVPILMSIMIISGAALGRFFLGEPVSNMMKLVIALFVIAIFMLGMGTSQPDIAEELSEDEKIWPLLGGVAAGLAGFAYAILGVSVRTSLKFNIPLATPMVFVGLTGAILIGALTFFNYGLEITLSTTGTEWFCLIGAAFSNSMAFLCLTKAFKHLPVVYVNMTNVAQVAMATLIALFYFQETFTIWLGIGLFIVILGYALLAKQPKKLN